MFVYESWANRMLPKFPFVEVMERLEVVGTKREVHSALQGLRAGTWPPAISAEFVSDSSGSNSDNEAVPLGNPQEDAELEELLRLPEADASVSDSLMPPPSTPQPLPVPSTSMATEEEESPAARIERNRRAALERLEARRRLLNATPFRGAPSSLKKALKPVNSSDNTI